MTKSRIGNRMQHFVPLNAVLLTHVVLIISDVAQKSMSIKNLKKVYALNLNTKYVN